jgi:hypothetical protein
VKNHFNARWYDADTARFVSEDPARDGVNWYSYVNNDPINRIDPLGLSDSKLELEGGGVRYTFDVGYVPIIAGISHTNIIVTDVFTGEEEIIVEAFPTNRIFTEDKKNLGFGNLEAADENIFGEEFSDITEDVNRRVDLPLAVGLSSEEMLNALLDYNQSYPDNIPYPGKDTGNFGGVPKTDDLTANSNSFVGTIIRDLGIEYDHPRFLSAPGWEKDVNELSDYYRNQEKSECLY